MGDAEGQVLTEEVRTVLPAQLQADPLMTEIVVEEVVPLQTDQVVRSDWMYPESCIGTVQVAPERQHSVEPVAVLNHHPGEVYGRESAHELCQEEAEPAAAAAWSGRRRT
jgi:hypothetical protein